MPKHIGALCLALLAMAPASDAFAGEAPRNWLESLFPSIARCKPAAQFYYEETSGRSVPGTLEGHGYRPRQVTHDVAFYDIDERFFGMRATEIIIPNHMGVVSVKLEAPVKEAKSRLERAFGHAISVYPKNADEPGVAYLYADERGHTSFVCTSEPG